MRYLALVSLLVFLTGCVSYSRNPLTAVNEQVLDGSIHGSWFWKEGEETGYLHIGAAKERGMLKAVMVVLDKEGKLDVSELCGHTSSLAGKRYLNLRWVHPAEGGADYLLVKYELKETKLVISIIDSGTLEEAVKSGALKGELNGEGLTSSVTVTEQQEKLQQFVLEHDDELFINKSEMNRLVAAPLN